MYKHLYPMAHISLVTFVFNFLEGKNQEMCACLMHTLVDIY